jgi:hypothetical protein
MMPPPSIAAIAFRAAIRILPAASIHAAIHGY